MEEAVIEIDELVYQIDQTDELVYTNDAWDRFATNNVGAAVVSGRVLHRPLFQFIADRTTQSLYRQAIGRVREGHSLKFPFRCDSPRCRRLLQMNMEPGPDGMVEFRTQILSETERDPIPLLEPNSPRSKLQLVSCGWCKRFQVGGNWVEVEQAIEQLNLFEIPLLPMVTHGICEPCLQRMLDTLANS